MLADEQPDLWLAQNSQSPVTPQQVLPAAADPAALLQSMRDIHLPETGGSQLAAGWVLLAAGVLLLLAMLLGFLLRRRRSEDWRQVAQQELVSIRQQAIDAPANETVAACSRLLRRVSLALLPREGVAAMTGENWLKLLDTLHGSSQFSEGPGQVLAELPYSRPVATADARSASNLVGGVDRAQEGEAIDHGSGELLLLVEDFIANAQPIAHEQLAAGRSTPLAFNKKMSADY